jgi:hypothetical protein
MSYVHITRESNGRIRAKPNWLFWFIWCSAIAFWLDMGLRLVDLIKH